MLAATFAVGQELANGVNSGPTGSQVRVKVDSVPNGERGKGNLNTDAKIERAAEAR